MKKKITLATILSMAAILAACGGSNKSESQPDSSNNYSDGIASKSEISWDIGDYIGETDLEGNGTPILPYLIKDKKDLLEFMNNPVMEDHVTYKLVNDIEFNDEWKPIAGLGEKPFKGTVDGDGHKITGLKISSASKTQVYYGFIGQMEKGKLLNITLDMNIDLTMVGKDSMYGIGGAVAYASNSSVQNVHVNYEKFEVVSLQNGNSYLYAGGVTSYFDSTSDRDGMYYTNISNCSVNGDIIVNLEDSNGVVDAEAGIVAVMDTGYYDGLMAVNNCSFVGDIEGGLYIAGIAASMGYYSSVVNCYVEADTLKSFVDDLSYVGGIAGLTKNESGLIGNYASVNHIDGTNSKSSIYKSFAGDIAGFIASDLFDSDLDILGCALYENYATYGTINSDTTNTCKAKTPCSEDLLKKIGFSSESWSFKDGKPELNGKNPSYKVKLTVDSNGFGKDTFDFDAGNYNSKSSELYFGYKAPKRAGFSYFGLYYDEEATIKWRWYAPIHGDLTLYCGYADLDDLVGDYAAICQYYERQIQSGTWKFTEDYFYWLRLDGSYSAYKYRFDGKYIFLEDYVGEYEAALGGYTDEIFVLQEDGTITGYDVNSDLAEYTATKIKNSDIEIPNLKGEPFLGKWTDGKCVMTILESCVVVAYDVEKKVDYFGGVIYDGTTLTIDASPIVKKCTLTYNPATDTLSGGGVTFERMK